MKTLDLQNLPLDLWQREESLRRAGELLDLAGGQIRAVTFDFFDTLVWRLVGKPTDVFNEVATRLHGKGLLRPTVTPNDYEVLRRLGEMKTREKQHHKDPKWEDITIDDIYTQMQAVVSDPKAAVPIEFGAECDLCVLNPSMMSFVQHVLSRGLKIIVISDIYFSSEHLRGILRANQLNPEIFDAIYTSADEGVCKGSGHLFERVLKKTGLDASQILHLGDNFHADVLGARQAGARGVHYTQLSAQCRTILDREKFLLGGLAPVFNANSLRMLTARLFPGESPEAFFSHRGALLMGPILTRYASWACEQFVAAGVRKVGAFMREGEIFGKLLQQEADARGYDLKIMPLFVNRKATGLAAIGRLTADNLLAWLQSRYTLPIKSILTHFGLGEEVMRKLPFAEDEKADKPEKILKLAKLLFTPEIASRIEAKSAEERRMVLDYMKPWLEGGHPLGLCDIGYNASAQTQIKRIFDLENVTTPMVGCYLVSHELAASRLLDGIDVRHFLGSFAHPNFYYQALVRAPAFMEQSIVAAMGTTLGYRRLEDGTVEPVLDRLPYDETMVRRQKCFKEGVLEYQRLWHWVSRRRPGLLDGTTDLSRRILADIDRTGMPILARATAFPLQVEVENFGSLALDDYYFGDAYKKLCNEKDAEFLRKNGFGRLLGEPGSHWPHGVFHKQNPRTASEFFSCGRTLLLCYGDRDTDGAGMDLSVIITAGRQPQPLREALTRLKAMHHHDLRMEIVVLVARDDQAMLQATQDMSRQILPLRVFERAPNQTIVQQLNAVADGSQAQYLLFMGDGVHLPAGWDGPLLRQFQENPALAVACPEPPAGRAPEKEPWLSLLRCFLIRRSAFIEGLGFLEHLSVAGAQWNLMLQLRDLRYQFAVCAEVTPDLKPGDSHSHLSDIDRHHLKNRCASFAQFAGSFGQGSSAPVHAQGPLTADWIGSFLDHGSLSHVNREFTSALMSAAGLRLQRVSSTPPDQSTDATWASLRPTLATEASRNALVTIRHAWPPDWKKPAQGALVVMQPWEFGVLPESWVRDLAVADECWVYTECVRRMYLDSGVPAEKVHVVPLGIDAQRFQPSAQPYPLATQKKFKFLFVGGTIHRKGPDILLKAYLQAFTAADDVCLVIKDFGGKSVYQGQTFEDRIRAAKAQPNAPEILYLDTELAPEALPGLYTACDCLVHPYRGEGFGLPVLEAMACGLPVIVTQGGATDDFATADFSVRIPAPRQNIGTRVGPFTLARSGWLLEPPAEQVSQAMLRMAQDPAGARTLGLKASEHVRSTWTWERAAAIAAARLQALARPHQGVTTTAFPAPGAAPVRKITSLTLPSCAKLGQLDTARTLLQQRQLPEAWSATLLALQERPFHPEAVLLLGEIAGAAGDPVRPRQLAERAAKMAPRWKPAQQFLKQLKNTKGPARVQLPALPESLQKGATPRLTICLITKNEERFLDQCLRSVAGLASQLVVVDTGSTDRTVEIARQHGAEIHSFTWIDDFSAARNAALAHARGDWVLMLDADEELRPDQHEALRAHLRDASALAFRLPIVDVGREEEGRSHVPRLYRNAPGLFYVGRVHEQVFSSVEVRRAEWGLDNKFATATLLHYGYQKEVITDRAKNARNLKLLELAIQEIPGDANLLMNLGLELIRSGRMDEGLTRHREAFQRLSETPASQVVPELRESLLTQLATHLLTAGRHEEIIESLSSRLATNGGLTATMHFLRGLAHMELRQSEEAIAQMRECIAKRQQPALTPIHKDIRKAGPHHCIAMCAIALHQPELAASSFQAALQDDPTSRAARFDYARFLASQQDFVPALEGLHQLVSANDQDAGAWELGGRIALTKPEFLEVARDWTAQACLVLPDHDGLSVLRAEALLLSGEVNAARPLWEKHHAPNNATHLAALYITKACGGEALPAPVPAVAAALNQEFVRWCQRLANFGALQIMQDLTQHIEIWQETLPGAARVFRLAIAEVQEVVPA